MRIGIICGNDNKTHQSGNVYTTDDVAPNIMAGTHGYGFGYILEIIQYDND